MKKALKSVVVMIFCIAVITSTMVIAFAAPGKISSAKASSITYNSATLSWSKASNADGYQIYQYKSSKWTLIKTTTATSYKITGLTTGTTYQFRIRAYDKGLVLTSYGSYTSTIKVKPVPVKVTGLKAAGTNTKTIKLSWTKVAGASGYEVQQYVSNKWKTLKNVTTNSYSVGSLKLNTTYKFRVRAYRTVSKTKVYGSYSATVSGKTIVPTPTSVKFKSITTSSGTIYWGAVSGATGYQVYNPVTKKWVNTKTTRSYTHKSLKAGTKYTYKVRAYAKVGSKYVYSAQSSSYSFTTTPAQTKGLKVSSITNKSVKASWTKTTGATGYQVYIYDYSGAKKWTHYKTVTGTSLTISGLKAVSQYAIRVRAYVKNTSGNSYGAWSSMVKTYTAPATPTGVSFSSIKTTSVVISWKKVTGASGYEIYNPVTKKWVDRKTSVSYTHSSLSAGTKYSYKVRAYKTSGSTKLYSPETSSYSVTTAPPQVTGLKASGHTSSSVKFSWTATKGATGYRFYLNGKFYKALTTASVTVTGLNPGTKYTVFVRAYAKNTSGNTYGADSAKFSTLTAPSVPTNVVLSATEKTAAAISWTAVTKAAGYEVYNPVTEKWVDIESATTYAYSSLTAGTTYNIQVRAYVKDGSTYIYGSATSGLSFTTNPEQVTGVIISNNTKSTLDVSWSEVKGATGYEVYLNGNLYKTATGESLKITGLSAATKYTVYVRAYATNANGNAYGDISAIINTITSPDAPTSISNSNITKNSATITWNEVANAEGYEVYNSVTKKWTDAKDKTSYTYTNLLAGTTYQIQVRAYTSVDSVKAYSTATAASACRFTTIPDEPNLEVTPATDGNSFVVSWPAVTGATYYQIEKSDNGADWSSYSVPGKTATSFKVSNAAASSTYYFRVRACINADLISDWATVQHSPMVIKAGNGATATSAHITWNAFAGATKYVVDRYQPTSYSWVKVGETTDTEYKPALMDNTGVLYRVTAYKDSTQIAHGTLEATSTGITLTKNNHSATVRWTALAGTSSYTVRKVVSIYSSSYGSWQNDSTTIASSATSFTFNLAPNEIHTYRITAQPSGNTVAEFTVSMGDLVIDSTDASKTSQLLMLVNAINRTKYRDNNVTVAQDSTVELSCDQVAVGGIGALISLLDPSLLKYYDVSTGELRIKGAEEIKNFMGTVDSNSADALDTTETVKETVTFTDGIGYSESSKKDVYLRRYLEPVGTTTYPLAYLYNEHTASAWKNGFSAVSTTKNSDGTYKITATLKPEKYGSSVNETKTYYHPGFISSFDGLNFSGAAGMDNNLTTVGATKIVAEISADGKLNSYTINSTLTMDLGTEMSGITMRMVMNGKSSMKYTFTR